LTGCMNFRNIMELLENEITRAKRYKRKFTITMIDIDHFKRINDEYGHLVGNDALVAFANVIKNSVRSMDIVGRYGGEEFLIILPESDSGQALVALERIKNDLEQVKISSSHLEKGKKISLQFSAGIAVFPHNARDLKELIWGVDDSLRRAKKEGRNRVVMERRRWVRLKPLPGSRIVVVGSSGKENIKDLDIVNISKGGMLLSSDQGIIVEELLCRMICPKSDKPFELKCIARRKDKSKNDLYHIGVQFEDIPDGVQERLSNCINSEETLDHPKVKKQFK
ncbi:diguanylate cyclase, partial [Candidatus Omnitrophota bacterium]